MASFSVTFTVEAATLEEVESLVATWTVTPGIMLMPIIGSVTSDYPPTEVPEPGSVSDAFVAAATERTRLAAELAVE